MFRVPIVTLYVIYIVLIFIYLLYIYCVHSILTMLLETRVALIVIKIASP